MTPTPPPLELPGPGEIELPGPGEIRCVGCGRIALRRDARWRWLAGHSQQFEVCAGCVVKLDLKARAALDKKASAWAAMSAKGPKR